MKEMINGYKEDMKKLEARLNELKTIIPRLKKEREQIIGMILVMKDIITRGEKAVENGSASDGDNKNNNKGPSDGKN